MSFHEDFPMDFLMSKQQQQQRRRHFLRDIFPVMTHPGLGCVFIEMITAKPLLVSHLAGAKSKHSPCIF
jgi:hypothetical protein